MAKGGSVPFVRLQLPKGLFGKFPGQLHMLLDIRLQMSGSCLPIVGGMADVAGEDCFVGVSGEKHLYVW